MRNTASVCIIPFRLFHLTMLALFPTNRYLLFYSNLSCFSTCVSNKIRVLQLVTTSLQTFPIVVIDSRSCDKSDDKKRLVGELTFQPARSLGNILMIGSIIGRSAIRYFRSSGLDYTNQGNSRPLRVRSLCVFQPIGIIEKKRELPR